MKKQSFMLIMLAILLGQPMIAGISMPTTTVQVADTNTLAQNAGYRLEPFELTDHVPIIIDGTADFVDQGWPGAGTPSNPYVIAGFNITQDLGMNMISIINTNASFVIRDCWISQGANTDAINLVNTTAATVEYNTIYSYQGGIYGENANNTLFDHNVIYDSLGVSDYGILVKHCTNNELVGNEIHSEHRAFYSWYCPNLVSNGNIFDASTNQNSYIYFCNGTTSTNDLVIGGRSFYISYSYDVTITGMYNNGSRGIQTYYGGNLVIDNNNFDCAYGPVLNIDYTTNVTISNNYLSAPSSYCTNVADSENLTFANNILAESGTYGFYVSNTDNIGATQNSLNDCEEQGIYIIDSDFITLDQNTLTDVGLGGYEAIYVNNCDNGSLTNTEILTGGYNGVQVYSSYNWSITDNQIMDVDGTAIELDTGLNTVINNNIVNSASEGINLFNSPNSTIVGNQISEIENQGMHIESSQSVDATGNTIDEAYSGIVGLNINNATILNNIITNTIEVGISIQNMLGGTVSANTIESGPLIGMYNDNWHDCVLEDNVLTDCGIEFESGDISEYYHQVHNNTVNGLPIYYAPDINGIDILASDYGQIFLVNNSWVDIHDNTFGMVTVPVEAAFSSNIDIWNLDTSYNLYGMLFWYAENVSIHDYTHYGSAHSGAIANLYGTNMSLVDSTIMYADGEGNVDGFYSYQSSDILIDNCVFDGNARHIFMQYASDVMISNSEFLNSENEAIYVMYTSNANIQLIGNVILNATNGIVAYNSGNWTIMDNVIMYCRDSGIFVDMAAADDVNITLNTIENNEDGIWISAGDDATITNNTIRFNEYSGIYLTGSSGTEVYYNVIAFNRDNNGVDQNFKYWDDGADTGNWWDDASPPAVYDIYGAGSSQDRYPMLYAPTEPIISQPQDIYYAEGSTGNEIIWFAYDDSLRNWEVEIDGSFWSGDAWNYNNITISIDGLAYGTHTVEITLWDVDLHNVTDSVTVTVFDDTPPTISNTPNTWVFVDGTDQTLSWKVADLHPDTYVVYLDDEEWDSGSWSPGLLEVDVDGISEGEYVLCTVIYDIDGNSISDTVLIRSIKDNTDPTIDSPADISYYVGETGNSIIWEPQDNYPTFFTVESNGSTLVEGSWGGARIVVNVDGLTVGTHQFTLTVEDGSGNSASDSVIVTVLSIEGVEPPPAPIDPTVILLIAGVVGAAIIIIVVIVISKKKRSPT